MTGTEATGLPRYGSQEEWDRYGACGDHAVRSALVAEATALTSSAPVDAPLALGFGAIQAIGEYLRVISNPAGIAVLEQNAMAYLRGALRGANGPILDSGQAFTSAFDA